MKLNERLTLAWGASAGINVLEKGDFLAFSGTQEAVDWQAGTYISEASGPFSNKLQWTHIKSTLGDGLDGVRTPIFYSRDRLSLTSSYKPWDWLRLYGQLGVKLWWDDLKLGGSQSSFAFGTELHSGFTQAGDVFLEGYGTYHWEYKDDGPGFIDQETQLGIRWRGQREEGPAIRTALLYYDGHSPFGQFWQETDRHWAFGLFFDL